MISDERFYNLISDYFPAGLSYENHRDHYEEAQSVVIGTREIEKIHNELQDEYNDERHRYQQLFITKSINGILSSFLSTRNQFYDSAYRDIRTLFETFLLLNHMNENKIKTAKIYLRQERDLLKIEEVNKKLTWEELYSEDKLHEMIRTERRRLEDLEEDYGQLYNFLSNTRVHPTRVDGIAVDRGYAKEEEYQLFRWQLDFILGMSIQILKLYQDTPAYTQVREQLVPTVEQIEEGLGHQHEPLLEVAIEESPLSES